jgi:mannose-6-phosphate isomerase-like protein (cupin superfamily)
MKAFTSNDTSSVRERQARYELVLVRLGPNEEIPQEVHQSMDQLFFVVSGSGIANERLLLRVGNALTIPAGTSHVIRALEGGMTLWTVYIPLIHGQFIHTAMEELRNALPDAPAEHIETIESLLSRMESADDDPHTHLLMGAAQEWTEFIGARARRSGGRRRRTRKPPVLKKKKKKPSARRSRSRSNSAPKKGQRRQGRRQRRLSEGSDASVSPTMSPRSSSETFASSPPPPPLVSPTGGSTRRNRSPTRAVPPIPSPSASPPGSLV